MSRVNYDPLLIGVLLMFVLSGCLQNTDKGVPDIKLTPGELIWIGDQVFRNECAGKQACLVHWNQGEAFPSLGIGHFIWYPTNVDGPFVESFPALIRFMRDQGVPLPEWLNELEPLDAPWPDRATFSQEEDKDGRVSSLREFLWATRGVQAEFIVRRARNALEEVVAGAPDSQQVMLRDHLRDLLATPGGTYAVVDYVNFKGEGLSGKETYRGQGWGLLQVLQAMADNDQPALQRFQEAAKAILTRRAGNAPRDIEREKWLPGWLARIETYREPDQ
ncbi:hypothetical protein [Marinobacter sp. HL-58]|uniref:hypothetical protein n=1 Tax=Marinobacter sp. HL-58 TaxID=1479237 RepID=UPI000B09EF5B|nr:hypothetical protein [Marinobacter sp. HL-58]